MPPRTRATGDENDAAEVFVDPNQPVIVPDPEAAETGGAKLIRCRHGDRFVYDPKAHEEDESKGVIPGEWTEFSATEAKAAIEAASRNGVRIAVADKKG